MDKKYYVVETQSYWSNAYTFDTIKDTKQEAIQRKSAILNANDGDICTDTRDVRITFRKITESEKETYYNLMLDAAKTAAGIL